MANMMEHAKNLVDESTIYGQTLGEPLGGNAPYSMVALLNQAGRLPLVTLQRRGSWGIGKAMEIAFMLMKDRGGKRKVRDAGSVVELSSANIPDDLIIEATLDIDLPQDKKQAIQMAIAATSGDRPLLDFETARKDLIGEEQSDEIDKKVMAERYAWLEFQKDYQKEMAMAQAEVQQKIQQAQMQGQMPPPQDMQQGQMQQGVPPDQQQAMMQQQMMMAQMAQQEQVQPGLPLTEPQQEGM
jgi:hypothetical protein